MARPKTKLLMPSMSGQLSYLLIRLINYRFDYSISNIMETSNL